MSRSTSRQRSQQARSSISHLPIEVIEVIVDHLHPDNNTLRSCTLTCKTWIPAARFHLLSYARLHQKNISVFLRLLDASHSRIAASITHLSLAALPSKPNDWMNNSITVAGKHLVHVKTLTLAGIKWSQLDSRATDSLLRDFRRVDCINLIDTTFRTFSQLVEFLCAFPLLRIITIDKSHWETIGAIPSQNARLSRSLDILMITPPSELLMGWLSAQSAAQMVSKISLDEVVDSRVKGAADLLKKAGSQLTDLRIRFGDAQMSNITNAGISQMDLSSNKRLSKLILSIPLTNALNPFARQGYNLAWIPRFLSSVSSSASSHLKVIRFSLFLVDSDDLTLDFPWREVDRVLELPAFKSLEKLQFALDTPATLRAPGMSMLSEELPDPLDVLEGVEIAVYQGLRKFSRRKDVLVQCGFGENLLHHV
ncbi:hypothetical protein BDQ12DRAFT_388273 [Crucibulum laeve]|uniref:F-box domain-containing protein n=1 Tax=Crucibulum laeve TaxID=68775 RepID=A0A5C3M860_9AGAR|nr:hypothetical protein BDQ12DRAFT_388273 [Crucibulum laeve]